MTDLSRLRDQSLLRQASGYIELGELLVENDRPVPAPSAKLLARGLDLLARLGEPARSAPMTLLLRGEALRALGRFEEALEPMRSAAEREPERLEAWLGMGWCLKRLDRVAEAIDALRRALDSAPEQAILHYNLACYWALTGNVTQTVRELAIAFDLDGKYRDRVATEPDFDLVRESPHFQALLSVNV